MPILSSWATFYRLIWDIYGDAFIAQGADDFDAVFVGRVCFVG